MTQYKHAKRAVRKALNEFLADYKLQEAILDDLKEIILHARVRSLFERSIEFMEDDLKELDIKIEQQTDKLANLNKQIKEKREKLKAEIKKFELLVPAETMARLKGVKN